MTNLIKFDGNKKKNKLNSTVGKVAITLPGGLGALTSGEEYKIASVPMNALILGVDLVVTEAFNGTTPTIDVEVDGVVIINDASLASISIVTDADRIATTALTDITVIPTISGATTGAAEVVVTFVELDAYDGAFTE